MKKHVELAKKLVEFQRPKWRLMCARTAWLLQDWMSAGFDQCALLLKKKSRNCYINNKSGDFVFKLERGGESGCLEKWVFANYRIAVSKPTGSSAAFELWAARSRGASNRNAEQVPELLEREREREKN